MALALGKMAMFVGLFVLGATAAAAQQVALRELHFLRSDEGDTKVILRTPLAMIFDGDLQLGVAPTPFLLPGLRLDSQAILDDYGSFAEYVLRDFQFRVDGRLVAPEMPEYVIFDTGVSGENPRSVAPGLISTTGLLSLCAADFPQQPRIRDTLVVMAFYLANVAPAQPVSVTLPTTAPAEFSTAKYQTHIIDHRTTRAAVPHISTGWGIAPDRWLERLLGL